MDKPVQKQPEFESESNSAGNTQSALSFESIVSESADSKNSGNNEIVSGVTEVQDSNLDQGGFESIPALSFAEVVNDSKDLAVGNVIESPEAEKLPQVEITERASEAATVEAGAKSTVSEVPVQAKESEAAMDLPVTREGAVVVAASDKVVRVATENVFKVEEPAAAEKAEVAPERVEVAAKPDESRMELPLALSALGTESENIYVEGTVLTNVDKSLKPYQLAMIGERVKLDATFDPSLIESTVNFNTNIRSRDHFVAATPVIADGTPKEIHFTSADTPERVEAEQAAFFERALKDVVRTNTEIVATGSRTEIVDRKLTASQLAQIDARVARDPEFDPASITTTVNLTTVLNQDLAVPVVRDSSEAEPVRLEPVAGPRKDGVKDGGAVAAVDSDVSVAAVDGNLPPALSALAHTPGTSGDSKPVLPPVESKPEVGPVAAVDSESALPPALAGLGKAVEARKNETIALTSQFVLDDAPEVKTVSGANEVPAPILNMDVVKAPVTVISTDRVEAPVSVVTTNRIEAPLEQPKEGDATLPVLDRTAAAATDFLTNVRTTEVPENKKLDPVGEALPKTFFSIRGEDAPTLVRGDRAFLATETMVLDRPEVRAELDTTNIRSREEFVAAVEKRPVIAKEISFAPESVSVTSLGDVPATEHLARVRVETALTERVEPVRVGAEVPLERTTAGATDFLKHVRDVEVDSNKSLDAPGRAEPETFYSIRGKSEVEPATLVVNGDKSFLASETAVLARPEVKAVIDTANIHDRKDLIAAIERQPVSLGEIVTAPERLDTRVIGDVAANETVAERRTELAGFRKIESLPPVLAARPDHGTLVVDSGLHHGERGLDAPVEAVPPVKPGVVDFLANVRANEVPSNKKLDVAGDGVEVRLAEAPVIAAAPEHKIVVPERILTTQDFAALSATERESGRVDTADMRSRSDLIKAIESNPVLASNMVTAYGGEDRGPVSDVTTLAQTMTRVIRDDVIGSAGKVDVRTGVDQPHSSVATISEMIKNSPVVKAEVIESSNQVDSIPAASKAVDGAYNGTGNIVQDKPGAGVEKIDRVDDRVISQPVSFIADLKSDNGVDNLIESNKNYYARGYSQSAIDSVSTDFVPRVREQVSGSQSFARQSNVLDGASDLRSLILPTNSSKSATLNDATVIESIGSLKGNSRSASAFDYSIIKQVSDAAAVTESGRKALNLGSHQSRAVVSLDGKGQVESSVQVVKATVGNLNSKVETALTGSIIDNSVKLHSNVNNAVKGSLNFSGTTGNGGELAVASGEVKIPHILGSVKVDGRRASVAEANFAVVSTIKSDFVSGTTWGEFKSLNVSLDGRHGNAKFDLSGTVKSVHANTQSVHITSGAHAAGLAHGAGKGDAASIVIKADGTIATNATNKIENTVKNEVTTVRSVENIIQTAKTVVNPNTASGLIAAVKYGEPLPEGMTYENGYIKLTHNGQVLYFPGLRAALKFVEGLGIEVNLDEDDDEEWYVQTLDKEGKSSRVQYVVVPGDTIESICETRLGDARYADLLITINRSEVVYRLHNGSKVPFVYPSQVLWLPSRYEMKVFRKNFFKDAEVAPRRFDATNIQLSPSGNLVIAEAVQVSDQAGTPDQVLARLHQEVVEHYRPRKMEESVDQGAISTAENSESGPLAVVIDRVRFAGGRESVGLKECPESVGSFSKRAFHAVEAGDTILSIATKRPELGDTRFWKLIAKVNGLTTRLDAFGIPCEALVPGQFLLMPDAREIEAFCQQEGIARGEKRAIEAKTVLTSELNIVSFSDSCRVSEIALGGEAHAFSINLQIKSGKEWKTIANYQFQGGKSVRTTYALSGVTSSMVINLPSDIVKEMAYEDFNRNWKTRIELYRSNAEKVETKNNLGEPPRPAFIAAI